MYDKSILLKATEYLEDHINKLFLSLHMAEEKEDYSFWTRYKQFAGTEIIMYLLMIIGIGLGIIFLS